MVAALPRLRRFLVELTPAESTFDDVQALTARIRSACTDVSLREPIRFLRSIFLPEDGTFLLLFEGASASAVEDAVGEAGLPVDWISELRRRN